MKRLTTTDLQDVQETDAFSQTVQEVKEQASAKIAKAFTLEQRHFDKINAAATALTIQRGKPVSASEALRYLIERAPEVGR